MTEHSWVTGYLMCPAPGVGGTLKPSEPCCSKGIALACLDIHLLPPLFSLLDSVSSRLGVCLEGGQRHKQMEQLPLCSLV